MQVLTTAVATPSLPALAALMLASMTAGLVDAVAGGGGLVQLPALLLALPQSPLPTLLGINKFASIWGTAGAGWRYTRKVVVPRHAVVPAVIAALIGAFAGAFTVTRLHPQLLRPLVLGLLVASFFYTLLNRNLGHIHAPRLSATGDVVCGLMTGAALGFYDGFFGPGTGSFLILIFVAVFGFSFLSASASAKLVNASTNLAALLYFLASGHVLLRYAMPMAASNLAGGWIGSHLAIRHGSGFVRGFFLIVVAALILRYGMQLL